VPSPHQDSRPPGATLTLVVLHGISLPPGEFGGPWIDALFKGQLPGSEHPYFATIAGQRVSAHLCIGRDGGVTQYVPFHRRAWHAGASSYRHRVACNDYSIGIELEGTDDIPYTDPQYVRLAQVLAALRASYPQLVDVAGHSDVAPGRKTDPGPAFDWQRVPR
jgi:AmpD protein